MDLFDDFVEPAMEGLGAAGAHVAGPDVLGHAMDQGAGGEFVRGMDDDEAGEGAHER